MKINTHKRYLVNSSLVVFIFLYWEENYCHIRTEKKEIINPNTQKQIKPEGIIFSEKSNTIRSELLFKNKSVKHKARQSPTVYAIIFYVQ